MVEPVPTETGTGRRHAENSNGPRILLVTAAMDRHARTLTAAFGTAGARVDALDLSRIGFDAASPSGLSIPGYRAGSLPDAVCVRTLDGGSFEQVTRRLGLLHALGRSGVPVTNAAPAIEACVDKAMASFRLACAGLPTPPAVAVESRAAAERLIEREGAAMVLKPLFGAQGKGLRLIEKPDDLPDPTKVGGVYYLQRFIGVRRGGAYGDMRVLVSRGRVVAAMRREAPDWITNIRQGARGIAMAPDAPTRRLAIAAAAAVDCDFCGVDLLRDAEDRLQVIEVNSMPAWTGIARATGLDIAAIRAGDVLALVAGPDRRPRPEAAE